MSILGRKTSREGPFRFTISRGGLTESFGTKRARISRTSRGRIRRSINFGGGFSWTK